MKRAGWIAGICLLALVAVGWWYRFATALPNGAPHLNQPWTNSLGMKFVPIPHVAPLVAVHETRVSDFREFVAATRRSWPQPEFALEADYPAVNVTWDDAVAFCEWLTARERDAQRLGRHQRYRLPTSGEWTLAAGIEDGQTFLWGNAWPPPAGTGNFAGEEAPVDQSNPDTHIEGYRDGFPRLAPIGKFPSNRFGLYDLAGNALEWCADWASPKKQGRIMRGGSWLNGDPRSLAADHATEIPPRAGFDVTGFRLVLDVDR